MWKYVAWKNRLQAPTGGRATPSGARSGAEKAKGRRPSGPPPFSLPRHSPPAYFFFRFFFRFMRSRLRFSFSASRSFSVGVLPMGVVE